MKTALSKNNHMSVTKIENSRSIRVNKNQRQSQLLISLWLKMKLAWMKSVFSKAKLTALKMRITHYLRKKKTVDLRWNKLNGLTRRRKRSWSPWKLHWSRISSKTEYWNLNWKAATRRWQSKSSNMNVSAMTFSLRIKNFKSKPINSRMISSINKTAVSSWPPSSPC